MTPKSKALNNFEHLVSMRASRPEVKDELNYWKAKKGKKNLSIQSNKADETGNHSVRVMVRKGK